MIREFTPIESPPQLPPQMQPSAPPEKKWLSTGFIMTLSIILGVLLTAGSLIGGLGNAFFVSRREYTTQELLYATDKSTIQQILSKLDGSLTDQKNVLEKQDRSLQKLVDSLQEIKVDMARKGR
jgi:hypothetical protein